jgi:putative flavoprotein involved in K+ transport
MSPVATNARNLDGDHVCAGLRLGNALRNRNHERASRSTRSDGLAPTSWRLSMTDDVSPDSNTRHPDDRSASVRKSIVRSLKTERYQTIVIGGGQAGLSVGYHLARFGTSFVILDASERVGDSWRKRWDSLRLFTPARYDGLDGMPFPASSHVFPTKDEMADYLEAYAARFALPVRNGVKVDRLHREDGRYMVTAGDRRFEADQVVVAMSNYQVPKVPAFARELDPGITQLHSSEYRNPAQLREGGVLVAGAGNSGSEIAMELARGGRQVWMSGRDTGHVPFRIEGAAGRAGLVRLVLRLLFHRVLTTDTWLGRKARPGIVSKGGPLIRVKPKDLAAAGIERVPRIAGVRGWQPLLEDGSVMDVASVVWCTGYQPGFGWIDLPDLRESGEPRHVRGVVADEPGLYFVGLHFLYSLSSAMIHGVGRDARFIAATIATKCRQHNESA